MSWITSMFQKVRAVGKIHWQIFCTLLKAFLVGIFLLGIWALWGICLNFVSPQMIFPNYHLSDQIQIKFLRYPKCFTDTHVVWGNGRIRLGDSGSFSDYQYKRKQDVKLIDCVNTRGETVTFDEDSFFWDVSVFRYKRGVIYAYSQRHHLFIMIDVKSVQYTYVNNPESLPSPHREEFGRLLTGSRGNYTYKSGGREGFCWRPDSHSTFSDAEDAPPLEE